MQISCHVSVREREGKLPGIRTAFRNRAKLTQRTFQIPKMPTTHSLYKYLNALTTHGGYVSAITVKYEINLSININHHFFVLTKSPPCNNFKQIILPL